MRGYLLVIANGRTTVQQRQTDQNLNIKKRQIILTSDQKHTDHFATRQLISRHSSLPNVFYFFSHRTFLKTILASRTSGTFEFAQHTKPTLRQNQKSHFFANARHKY
jgi:hypothetical protein